MKEYFNVNKIKWNETTKVNVKSTYYAVDEFKKGKTSLKSIELDEVGDVSGKSLLHLQCHFGLDTLAWARRGAKVTGIDISEESIKYANSLSKELNIPGRFICCNLYDLPDYLSDKFDIVYTSYGVLCWLPDLKEWAKIISQYLKKGGFFYIVEGHPLINIFDNERETSELIVKYSYFHSEEPDEIISEGYLDSRSKVRNKTYQWSHSISDIINSLILEGLKIEFFNEFPYCFYDHFSFMEEGEDGWWRLKGYDISVPLTFSLKATKV